MNTIAVAQLATYKKPETVQLDTALHEALHHLNRKILVLDDDPTGVQTVHGIAVYTHWDLESIRSMFEEPASMVFILTNSRGMTAEETRLIHQEIMQRVVQVSEEKHQAFLVISRSDSTLRGHYPLETEVIRETVEASTPIRYDGEVIIPFFMEGGRYTIGDIHYVKEGDQLIPAGQTEFARDKTFGYSSSNLRDWCEEKTKGHFPASSIISIALEDLRSVNIDKIVDQLMSVQYFNKIVVNAIGYEDVKVFVLALAKALGQGKEFLFRSAAALTKVIGNVGDRPLLTRKELIQDSSTNGGIIIVGSHVNKTTKQLEALTSSALPLLAIEFNQHLVVSPEGLEPEVQRVVALAEKTLSGGKSVVIATRRDRFDLMTDDKEAQLRVSVKISDSLTSVVERLSTRPSFIIAKGGITSSDVGTKALKVKRALVMGQIKPGIPVWMTGKESKYPDLPYVIFPGNVGEVDTLREIVEILMGKQELLFCN
jgi:uncharacterized protein YgbK (DUF1537 family)